MLAPGDAQATWRCSLNCLHGVGIADCLHSVSILTFVSSWENPEMVKAVHVAMLIVEAAPLQLLEWILILRWGWLAIALSGDCIKQGLRSGPTNTVPCSGDCDQFFRFVIFSVAAERHKGRMRRLREGIISLGNRWGSQCSRSAGSHLETHYFRRRWTVKRVIEK